MLQNNQTAQVQACAVFIPVKLSEIQYYAAAVLGKFFIRAMSNILLHYFGKSDIMCEVLNLLKYKTDYKIYWRYFSKKETQMIVFDKFYEGYDNWYTTKTGAFVDKIETKAAFELLRPEKGMRILDVGCGTGNFTYKIAEIGCDVTGIDISKKMLEQARAKGVGSNGSISFEIMNGSSILFDNELFDAVISMAAFEFIPDPLKVYNEMKRVVKPGGHIVIGTIQKGGEWAKLYSSDVCADTAYAHAEFKSKNELMALDSENLTAASECLFIPPGLDEKNYSMEAEEKAKEKYETGGFVCVKFQKKA